MRPGKWGATGGAIRRSEVAAPDKTLTDQKEARPRHVGVQVWEASTRAGALT